MLLATGLIITATSFSQNQPSTQDNILEERLEKVSSATVVDVHRFMGHENLLPKYLSLPYDVNMNTNVDGELFDPGFLILAILPIILLFYVKKNRVKLLLMFLLLCSYLIGSLAGYSAEKGIALSKVNHTIQEELKIANDSDWYISTIKLNFLLLTNKVSEPILHSLNNISGKGDTITYPILLVLFLLVAFFLLREVNLMKSSKWVVTLFCLVFLFFWLILGAGILYY